MSCLGGRFRDRFRDHVTHEERKKPTHTHEERKKKKLVIFLYRRWEERGLGLQIVNIDFRDLNPFGVYHDEGSVFLSTP